MREVDLTVIAGLVLAVAMVAVLAWFLYGAYLDGFERRLATRKGLYRELVSELATGDRALLEPTILKLSTLYDLDALQAVLEEQGRTATGRPGWLLEVYDRLGLVDKYIEKLRSARKWRDRAFAAELLGRVGSAKAVPALLETVQATRTEDSDVREMALRALARIADPLAVEPLIAALATTEDWLAPRIADILVHHGDVAVDPLLVLLSESSRRPAKAWAAYVLGQSGAQRAFPALIRGLDDPDDEVRAKSAMALGRLADRRAVTPLLDRLLNDAVPFVRVRIISALRHFDGPEVIDGLIRGLGDPAWWVRLRSLEALEQIGSAAQGPLFMALSDSDAEIRQRAAAALERLGVTAHLLRRIESDDASDEASRLLVRIASSGSSELLAELLLHPAFRVREIIVAAIRLGRRSDVAPQLAEVASNDPESSLRALAFDTLRHLRASTSLPAALNGVADPDQTVRIAALRLIGQTGDRNVIDFLRSHTADPEPQIRAAAIDALAAIGGRSAEPDFLRLMGDLEPRVREAAVQGATGAGLRSLAPAIMELLADNNERVRRAAAKAISVLDPGLLPQLIDRLMERDEPETRVLVAHSLGRLRQPQSVEHLSRLAGDPDPSVRLAAIQALGRCVRYNGPPPEDLVQTITGGLSDSDETVRAGAIDGCIRICLEGQARTLLSMLQQDPAPLVRERAALTIGLLRSPGGESALLAACHRAEPANVRAAAALAAGAYNRTSLATLVFDMPDETSIRELLRERIKADPRFRLLSRRLPRASGVELRAVTARNVPGAQAALVEGVHSVLDASERVRLISGLLRIQGEQSLSSLLQLVRGDPSAEVRAAALTAVGELLDPDELLAFGSRALGDPSIMVRCAAVRLFGKVPPARALPRLIQALRMNEDPGLLAAVAGLAEKHFTGFRDSVLNVPLESSHAVLVARLSRFIRHPDVSTLLSPLSRSGAPDVREAVAEVWRQRPDAADPVSLEAMTADPVLSVRRTAASAAAAAGRYDLLDRMTQDPEAEVRREIAITLGHLAPVGQAGLLVLEHLAADGEMSVRAAAHVARLLQGIPIPFPPDLEPRVVAEAVRDGADLGALRNLARAAASDQRRLSAALALALIQDEVAREAARSDPVPGVRHRVAGALELSLASLTGESA